MQCVYPTIGSLWYNPNAATRGDGSRLPALGPVLHSVIGQRLDQWMYCMVDALQARQPIVENDPVLVSPSTLRAIEHGYLH